MRWVNKERLGELLTHVRGNPHSGFYDKKYAGLAADEAHFFELPMLTRAELGETPLRERTFCPQKDIRFAAFTSGTTSKEPLIIPFAKVEDYHFEPSLGLPIERPLIIHPPMMRSFGMTFIQQCEQADHPVSPVFGDIQSMPNSAALAAAVGCDSVYTIPTLAGLLAPHALSRGVADKIKLLALSSETLTSARRAELKSAFPNALLGNLYGSAELGQLLMFTCPTMMRHERNHFHITAEALAAVELVEGELVVSYGLNRASPLVRYRTGDYFDEVSEGCPCGLPGPTVAWSHRRDVDRVRLNGMEFDAEAADRAFATFPHLAGVPYQVHFNPVEGSSAVALDVEISAEGERGADLARFAEAELPDSWRISATATVRTALERGLLSSFSVRAVPALSVAGVKGRRFVNHVA